MSRGDRREDIFWGEDDRRRFVNTLGEVCLRCRWVVDAYCLMSNHFHLVIETPQPNLVVGMKWLLGTYTTRFNVRHQVKGHLFAGRYRSILVDDQDDGYLRSVCDYVHLNPVRAGLLAGDEPLTAYRWSSFPDYVAEPNLRPSWLRTERLIGAHGILKDSPTGRRELVRRMEARSLEDLESECETLRRGWRYGAEDFLDRVNEHIIAAKPSDRHHLASERRESDEAVARRIIARELDQIGWNRVQLIRELKGHPAKVWIARELRTHTPMTLEWIARELEMGSWRYLRNLLRTGSRRKGE